MPVVGKNPGSLLSRLVEIFVVALVTVLAMHLGQITGLLRDTKVSPLWPATGVNIAIVFLRGPRVWPGILLGSFLDNAYLFYGTHPTVLLLAPIADTLEPLGAFYLYRLFRGGSAPLACAADTMRYIICCSLIAPAMAAALGVVMLWRVPGFFDSPSRLQAWIDWGLPASVGAMVITPALICGRSVVQSACRSTCVVHAAGIIVSFASLEYWVFGGVTIRLGIDPHLLIFLVLPLIVWSALVFGPRGGAVATLVSSVIAVVGAVRGLGPFHNLPVERALIILQVYLAAFAMVSMLLGAVTEERAKAYLASARQARQIELLFEELNHRVRNNLSSLLALIDLSRAASRDVDRFATLISGRVKAMAEIHSVLASGRWVAMSINDLVRSVAPAEIAPRITLNGPPSMIPPQQAMALGLVFHELVTNSLKHGALATAGGTVDLTWTLEDSASDGRRVDFAWREHPSSSVAVGLRTLTNGHPNGETALVSGLKLIDGLIRSDLQGRASFTFPANGARHTFDVRLESSEIPA